MISLGSPKMASRHLRPRALRGRKIGWPDDDLAKPEGVAYHTRRKSNRNPELF